MTDAGPCGPLCGGCSNHLKLLGTVACLTWGGPKRREAQAARLRVASSDGGSGCWWQLFRRGAAWDPRRTKAQYVRPSPVAPSLRGLQRVLAAWRRRPQLPEEEIPLLLVLECALGAA